MAAAKISLAGKRTKLDLRAEPRDIVHTDDVKDPDTLAQLLGSILQDTNEQRKKFTARRIDFEDITVDDTGATKYRLLHKFGGRVRWWVVDFSDAGTAPACLERHADTDDNALVLVSYLVGKVTVRVEEAG